MAKELVLIIFILSISSAMLLLVGLSVILMGYLHRRSLIMYVGSFLSFVSIIFLGFTFAGVLK